MVKFVVLHSCGHEGTHAFSGPEPLRMQREAWLRLQPCQQCWRLRERGAAAAQRRAWDLPALEGSSEQIAWAEVIRAKVLTHNRDYYQQYMQEDPFSDDPSLREIANTAAERALHELQDQKSAQWWLDHRFDTLSFVKYQVVAAISPIVNARPVGQ